MAATPSAESRRNLFSPSSPFSSFRSSSSASHSRQGSFALQTLPRYSQNRTRHPDDYVGPSGARFRRFGMQNIFISHDSQLQLLQDDNLWEAIFVNDQSRVESLSLEPFCAKNEVSGVIENFGRRGDCERGGEGESILHLAVLFKHKALIKWIIETFPGLLNSIYVKSGYFGETPLHIAVVNSDIGDDSIVRLLVENGAKVNGPVVSGTEFLKDDEQGVLYFGQTILQFAVATHKNKIVKYLVENEHDPAELDTVDIYGNNVLHIMAYYGDFDRDVFNYLKLRSLKNVAKAERDKLTDPSVNVPANLMLARNKDNFTPFQLGVARGNANIIETIKDLQWQFGSVRNYRVCIDDIDPIQPHIDEIAGPKRVSKSAVEIAVEREDKNVLNHPLFEAVLKVKWNLYIRQKFMFRFIATVLLVLCLTISIGLQPYTFDDRRIYNKVSTTNKYPITRGAFEGATLLGVAILLVGEFQELAIERVGYFFGFGSNENIVQWFFSFCVISIPIIRFGVASDVRDEQWFYLVDAENIIMGITAIVGWLYLLKFSKGFKQIGPLMIVFKKILFGDLLQWLALYVSITAGFSAALFLQMNDVPAEAIDETIPILDWNTYFGAVMWTVRFIFAQALVDDLRHAKLPGFAIFLFISYGFFVLILLLNVLIAKLVETFKDVAKDSTREWTVLFAYLIIDTDEKLTKWERRFYLSHLGWHTDNDSAVVTPRYFLFTERDVPDPRDPKRTVTETLKLVVARDANGRDIEINIDSDNWKEWYNDLIKPFKTLRNLERAHLWNGHHMTVSRKRGGGN
ncbi:hypothetical protein HDU82_004489 [Entophlyctis luteolus]|nr:hypothetical protein HDU82_004489 [Entophlyctis luteolus]